MAVEDELAEVEQQVLAARLDSFQPASVEPLYSRGTTAAVTGPNPEFLSTNGRFDSSRGPQDRVALRHALST